MEKLRHEFSGRLTDKEILTIVDDYKKDVVPEVLLKNAYAKGNNPTILERKLPSTAPNNKVPVPYARRIVSLITSYMFLPGLITYSCEDQPYLEALQEIFDANEEPLQNYQIGWQSTVHGVGYEIFYNEGEGETETAIDAQPAFEGTVPRFERVPVEETIPIYDFAIQPKLKAFIRFYTIESADTEYIIVYYEDVRIDYERRKNQNDLIKMLEQPHGYDRPPLVVYENNDDLMGDFSAVQPLIDAYDVLMSDSMNEFDRFAQAYLIAKGFTLTKEDVQNLKQTRTISLSGDKDTDLAFLTKPIEIEFIKFMSDQLRAEIHRGAGIPNLDDYKWGGGASGETIDKFIYLMELFSGIKEANYRRGLKQRIEMLTAYANLAGDPADINIEMHRNDPDKSMLLADLFGKYSGHVSEQTLLENFADFVPDAEEEMKRLKKEKDQAVEDFMRQNPPEEEEEEPEAGPPKPGEKKPDEK